jgi:serine/threonine protein kinase
MGKNVEVEAGRSQHPHPTDNGVKGVGGQEHEAAENLAREAPGLLKEVEESYLVRHHQRSYPTFKASEVNVGPLLGAGGFGLVFEVEDLNIQLVARSTEDETHSAQRLSTQKQGQDSSERDVLHADDDPTKKRHVRKSSGVSFHIPTPTEAEVESVGGHESDSIADIDDSHYDVLHARSHMKKFVRRDGDARYAIKRLRKDLNELARTRGMLDLAIEARFLSGLWHPNISKYREVHVLFHMIISHQLIFQMTPQSR